MKVLLTGFDAFGGESVNASWLAVHALGGQTIAGHTVVAAMLPTVFESSVGELARLMRLHRPAWVVCVGQAGGRDRLSIEQVAINFQDATIADNAGYQPSGTPVVAGGPAAYFSTLPVSAMLFALQQAGIPAEISQTAGTFVCNHVFYTLMHALSSSPKATRPRGGFIHVPFLPDQGAPSMRLDQIISGLHCAVEAAITSLQGDATNSSEMTVKAANAPRVNGKEKTRS